MKKRGYFRLTRSGKSGSNKSKSIVKSAGKEEGEGTQEAGRMECGVATRAVGWWIREKCNDGFLFDGKKKSTSESIVTMIY